MHERRDVAGLWLDEAGGEASHDRDLSARLRWLVVAGQ